MSDSTLQLSLERQDELFSSAFSILLDAINDFAFPAVSIAVTDHNRIVALKTLGNFVYSHDKFDAQVAEGAPSTLRQYRHFPVTPDTVFDLASVTKVVATTPTAMLLYERGLVDLDSPLAAILPEFTSAPTGKDSRRSDVTFRMLLAHSSGLPAYETLFLKAKSRDELLHAAFAVPLAADPATRAEYSDIGFILLGAALERITGESLDIFCQREIFGPLGMTHTKFNPSADLQSTIPPTADERDEKCGASSLSRERQKPAGPTSLTHAGTFRGRIIQGEVQDENAFVLGGVAGHAGLFSTAGDVAKFAHAILQCGWGAASPNQIFQPETIALFTQRQTSPQGTSRALGWDTPSQPSQSGNYFSPASFGHLGYTGTSLWVDPVHQFSITLLTNRTWPDCSNQAIKQVRPRFHDAVVLALRANRL